jgi:cytochrome c554/c'-like protein
MLDPRTCQPCHVAHFSDWSLSVHATASSDPVFIAMNARGQRETHGALGSFCVQCHAPMAVRDGLTSDGLNLASLPLQYQGVTCFFCHTVASVTGSHNAALDLSTDLTMRGEFNDPIPSAAHASAYSLFHDAHESASASMCGSCHDVVVPETDAGIERTFYEWAHSAFSGAGGATCASCHMTPSAVPMPIANVPGAPPRISRAHDFPAVDVSLPSSPDAGAQISRVEQELGNGAIQGALCVTGPPGGSVRVILDAVGVGHKWPSGAAQDRRAWAEVVAYSAGAVIYQSGVVPDGTAVTAVQGDPDLWLLRDCMSDSQGHPVNQFWQAASTEGNELPALATFSPTDPRFYQTHVVQRFPRNGAKLMQRPDRVTLRVRLQPVGIDVLQDLIGSQDLDAGILDAMPTYDVPLAGPTVPAQMEWTAQAASGLTYPADDGTPATCVATPDFNIAAMLTLATDHVTCSP